MVGSKIRVLEGVFFLVNASSLENCRDTGEVITEATLMGSESVARIDNVRRFMETVPVF